MKHPRTRRCRLAIALLFAVFGPLSLPSLCSAGTTFHYSFILQDTQFATNPEIAGQIDPNTIFSYDPATQLAVPTSTRLANAIAAQFPGQNVRVDALSYGYGAICLAIPHGDLFFSIARNPANGSHAGLPGSDLHAEHDDDSEADLYWVPNVPELDSNKFFPNTKATDDNSAPGAKKRFATFPFPRTGLHGSIGIPNGVPPALSNIGAFDYHPPNYSNGDIYFSIDSSLPGFHQADILLLPAGSTTITTYKLHTQLDLLPDDNIDALSVDIHHSLQVPQCTVGLYSLTRDSATEGSGADIWIFREGYDPMAPVSQCNVAPEIYRFASGNGVCTDEGEIDCIVSIDPLTVWRDKGNPQGTVIVLGDDLGAPESYSMVLDGVDLGAKLGTTLDTPIPTPFTAGDTPLIETYGKRGRTVRFGGSCKFDVPGTFDAIPADTVANVVLGSTVEVTWSNPIATAENEIQLDDNPPILVSATTSETFIDVAPGVHTVHLRAIGPLGERSLPVSTRFEVETSVPTPGNVTLTENPNRTLTVSWEHDPATTSIEPTLDGVPQSPIAVALGSTSGSVTYPISFGVYRVELVAVSPLGSSVPSPAEIYVPRPRPGQIINSADYDPGSAPYGMTFVEVNPATGEPALLINDRLTDVASYFDLELGLIDSISNPAGVAGAAIRGVAAFDSSSELLWLANVAGIPTLYSSDLSGGLVAVAGEATEVGLGGDLCAHPEVPDGFVVADLDSGSYRLVSSTGTDIGFDAIENPASDGIEGAVACRPGADGFIDIPTAFGVSGVVSHFATLELNGERRTSAAVAPLAGTVTGMVYHPTGTLGIPVIYCVTDGEMIYEIAAHDAIPSEEDCHLPLFGGISARNSTTFVIPDEDPVGVESSIELTAPGTVNDLDVVVAISHPRMSDLTLEVISPIGTSVTLQSKVLPYQGLLAARFDDVLMGSSNDVYGDRSTSGPGQLEDFEGQAIAGTWTLRAVDDEFDETGTIEAWSVLVCPGPAPNFLRGDANSDGNLNISDPITVLDTLFSGGAFPTCADAADANDDGAINIADGVFLLNWLFVLGPEPFAPGPMTCGPDPTADSLTCGFHPCS